MHRCVARRGDVLAFCFPGLVQRSCHWAAGTQLRGGAGIRACRPPVVLFPEVEAQGEYKEGRNIPRAFSTKVAHNPLLLVCTSSPSPSSEAVILQCWQLSQRPSVLEQSPVQMGIRAMALVVFLGVQNPLRDCNHSQLLLGYMGHDLV